MKFSEWIKTKNENTTDVDALRQRTEISNQSQSIRHKIVWQSNGIGRCIICGDMFRAGENVDVRCWHPQK